MKKIFLAAAFLTATVISGFANPVEKSDPKAEQIFNRQFVGAQNISWSRTEEGVLKVNFVWAGHSTVAYFNEKSEIVASVRALFYDQLPLTVIRSVESKYQSPVVIEVREISNEEGTQYALVLEEKEKKYSIRLNSLGEVINKERIKK
jgi:hypothetical protein